VGANGKQCGEESGKEHQLAAEPNHHANGQHRRTIVDDLPCFARLSGNRLTHATFLAEIETPVRQVGRLVNAMSRAVLNGHDCESSVGRVIAT